MTKQLAIEVLSGGTGSISAAADAIGVSYQAIEDWPPVLTQRIADRVIAAVARKHPSRAVKELLRRMEELQAQSAGSAS